MPNLTDIVEEYVGRPVDFIREVELMDVGDGPFINEWNVVGVEMPTQAQLDAAGPAVDAALALVPMRLLRLERDKRLAATDWLALPDSPAMSDEQSAYRQALRDLPANTVDPSNPVWPTRP